MTPAHGPTDDELALKAAELAALLLERAGTPAPAPAKGTKDELAAALAAAQAENARLRELVGPDEAAYAQLKTELWAARDAAIGAEMEAGQLRGQLEVLRDQVIRAQRNYRFVTDRILAPAKRVRSVVRGH